MNNLYQMNHLLQKKLRDKNIFITGGTGFFGKNLLNNINFLNEKYYLRVKVTLLSRNTSRFVNEFPEFAEEDFISFIEGDIRNFLLPQNVKYDYIIHGATETNKKSKKENTQETYSVIVDGIKCLLKQITHNPPKRLLYISSGGVYGVQQPDIAYIPEDFPCNPFTSYGKGKQEAEKLCLESVIPTSIARCFAFVGPYLPLNIHFAVGNFIFNGLRNEPIIIKGDGSAYRSYMHTEDLVNWLWNIILNGKNGQVYNVGSNIDVSILDLAHLVNKCFGNKLKIKILGQLIPGASDRYVPSIEKAKKELDLKLLIGLEESISKTIEWYKNEMKANQ